MGNKTKVALTVEIEDKWLPQFMGFLDALNRYSRNGKSGLLAFYADAAKDFKFIATVDDKTAHEMAESEEWGYDSWTGSREVDLDKAIAKPSLKDMECPGYCYGKVDEVFDRD